MIVFYVSGKVENVDVMFTTDTGASKTLISEEVYKRIHENYHQPHHSDSNIKEYGKAVFEVELGGEKLEQ